MNITWKNHSFNAFESMSRIVIGTFFSFCTVFTVISNLLVITAIFKYKHLRTVTNLFIVSLAFADLLMGSVVMPLATIHFVTNFNWIFGELFCKFWQAFDVLSSTASIFNLCAIAIERYRATKYPINYSKKLTKASCILYITFIWTFSALISFPPILYLSKSSSTDNYDCSFINNTIYQISSSMISFYIPLAVMIIVYYKIFITAKDVIKSIRNGERCIKSKNSLDKGKLIIRMHKGGSISSNSHANKIKKRTRHSKSENDIFSRMNISTFTKSANKRLHSFTSPDPILFQNHLHRNHKSTHNDKKIKDKNSRQESFSDMESDKNLRSSLKSIPERIQNFYQSHRGHLFTREHRAAKTLGIVMGVFIVCWLPFFICNIIFAFKSQQYISENNRLNSVFVIVTWLGYINSCMNPVIYARSMKDFRQAFIKILCIN